MFVKSKNKIERKCKKKIDKSKSVVYWYKVTVKIIFKFNIVKSGRVFNFILSRRLKHRRKP